MKKNFKMVILVTVFIVSGFLLGACVTSAKASDNMSNNIESNYLGDAIGSGYGTYSIIDKETGVNYIVLTRWSTGGEVAMCPRYNADGTLYVSK